MLDGLGQLAARHAEGYAAPRLVRRDRGPEEPRVLVPGQREQMAARIHDGGAEGLGAEHSRGLARESDDGQRLIGRQSTHPPSASPT